MTKAHAQKECNMAQKTHKAMVCFLKRDGYFIEAVSLEELAAKLAERRGGDVNEWKKEIHAALRDGTLKRITQGGKQGYRTLEHSEVHSAANTQETVNQTAPRNTQMAVAS